MIDTATIVGKSLNTETDLNSASPQGIVAARSENFGIENTNFYKFGFNSAACIGTCSQCGTDNNGDPGARTLRTN